MNSKRTVIVMLIKEFLEVISNKIIEMNDQIDDLNKKIDELSARLPK